MNNPGETKRSGWLSPAVWLALIVALAVVFSRYFHEIWQRWFPAWRMADWSLYDRVTEGNSYYTHGPIIPVVSFFIILLLIRKTKVPYRPKRRAGAVVLTGSLLLHLAACYARVNFVSGFAFIGVLVGLVLLLWGAAALRRLWFPLAFLVFMVPLPEVTIARLNFSLKMFATRLGVLIADGVGIIAVQKGNKVLMQEGKELVVANVCNGLRTLISLLAFGALYTYVCRLKGVLRLLLFALTVPVALLSNAIRVMLLILVADLWSVALATGWFHDSSGILIYVMAFLLMFGLERLILWLCRAVGRPVKVTSLFSDVRRADEDEDQWPRLAGGFGCRAGVVAVVLVAALGGVGYYLAVTIPASKTKSLATVLPHQLEFAGADWYGYDGKLEDKILAILEWPDYLTRRYVGPGSETVSLSVLFSRDNRKGIHPPDQCLAGEGDRIVAQADRAVTDVEGRGTVPCREIIVSVRGQTSYHLYTYKCGDDYTANFWYQQILIVWNGLLSRDASGGLIMLQTPARGGLADARQRTMGLLREAVPHLDANLR